MRRFSKFVPTAIRARTVHTISKQELREKLGKIQILDVREPYELEQTGKIDDTAFNLPLQHIVDGALGMDGETFFSTFGFVKPNSEKDCVFVCKAGVRSRLAQSLAREHYGFKSALNYTGGADEWFSEKI